MAWSRKQRRGRSTMQGWRAKLANRENRCACWDCLREDGITPPAIDATRHRDSFGKVRRTDNGRVDRQKMQPEERLEDA